MKPLISVIVPIYNVEEYLHECIDSILNQTYDNLEIILIDDGSPDNCGKICEYYKKIDNRVIVIHKSNGGLSDARNAGLKIANGSYYYFVDSDDRLPVDSISCMYEMAVEAGAQMVIGGFERFRDKTGEVFFSTDSRGITTKIMTKVEAMRDFFRDGCQAWAVLYKREIHEGIYFPKGEINEDEAIVFYIMERCETIVVTNMVVYSYRNREESITTTQFSRQKLSWKEHCAANLDFVREKYPQLVEPATARYRESLMWSLSEIAMLDNWKEYQIEVEQLMTTIRENRNVFQKIPFALRRDAIRYKVLMWFGYKFYRIMLCVKRGKSI